MESGVDDDPGDKESREGGHESLFGQLPLSSVFLFVDGLESAVVGVDGPGVESRESHQSVGALDAEQSPKESQCHAEDLPRPIDHVQELLLVRPLGTGRKCPGQHGSRGRGRRPHGRFCAAGSHSKIEDLLFSFLIT